MWKAIIWVKVLLLIIIPTLTGCISHPELSKSTILTLNPNEDRIVFDRTMVGPNSCDFYGTSLLADGTKLQSQLYLIENGRFTPVGWWPVDKTFVVTDGKWAVEVQPSDLGGSLSVGPSYELKIWAQTDPSIAKGFSFDLVGPPLRGTNSIKPSSTP